MRFPFVELPDEAGGRPRPVIPVQLEGLEEAPLPCLIDTGATANRFGVDLAADAGVPLEEPLANQTIVVGGVRTEAACVRVDLTIGGHRYEAPVWFCDPWPLAFGLLGQEGFLRFFRVTICVAEDWLECEPEATFSA